MFLSLTRFIENQLPRVFSSTHIFKLLTLRILRVTLITLGTSSAIYAIKFLPKLREKELLLERYIKHRLSLETLIADRTTHDEHIKQQITDLHNDYEQLHSVYIQLESEENHLSNTMETFINNHRVLHHSLSTDTNEAKRKMSELCLPILNKVDTADAIITDSINNRSRKFFSRILWLKKKKQDNTRGDGDA